MKINDHFLTCIMVLLLPLSLTHITLPSAVQGMEIFLPLSVTYSWYFIDDVKTVRTALNEIQNIYIYIYYVVTFIITCLIV